MNPIENCNLNWNFLERFGEEENIRDLIITAESQEALQEIKDAQNQLGCCHHTQKWCGKKIDHTLGFAGNLVKATLTTGFVIAATGFLIDTAADHFTGHRPMQSMLQYNLRLLQGGYAMYQGENSLGSFSEYKDHFWESPFSTIKNATLTTAKATGSLLTGFVTNKAANKTGVKTAVIAIASTIFSYQLLKNSNEFSLVSSGFISKEEEVAKTIEEQKEVIQESQTEFFQIMANTLYSKGKGTLQDQYQAFYLSKKIKKNLPKIKEIVDQQSLPKSILKPLKKQVIKTINKPPFDLSTKDRLQLMAKDPRYHGNFIVKT